MNYEKKGTPVQNRRRPEASTDATGRTARYGRFFLPQQRTVNKGIPTKQDDTTEYERKRPNTNPTDRDRERDKIEGEIEILSLFPLGFLPT